jgi:glutamyl-tRNA reductase
MRDKTREEDIKELERIIRDPMSDANKKYWAREVIRHISNPTAKVLSMRESLLKEMRNGRTDNVKDITEWAQSHSEYKN